MGRGGRVGGVGGGWGGTVDEIRSHQMETVRLVGIYRGIKFFPGLAGFRPSTVVLGSLGIETRFRR